jgi:tol-pal system protein YbgF
VSKLGRAELNEAAPVAKTADLSEELSSVARSPEGSLSIPKAGAPLSARDLYNQGFKQLNQTDYKGAEASFLQFTKTYSGDPLVGNAWYWLGEAYYVQRDYVKSANSFRQGYTKLPDGPKAGDNLLKLAMSLSALQKTPEACVVLKQVDKKFSANSEALKNKAREELSRLSCK